MNHDSVWLQPGTRLHMIVFKLDHWEVWTSTDRRVGDSATWRGTYMCLYEDGTVIQCIRTETEQREFIIREGASEQ